jgi:hypothetical protein
VTAIRKKRYPVGSPDWPKLLAKELDPIMRAAVRRRRNELGG